MDFTSSQDSTDEPLETSRQINQPQPIFKFTEEPWTPQQVLNFWEDQHGLLSDHWRNIFLKDPLVLEMCNEHPGLIREAIENRKKIKSALAYIYVKQDMNLEATKKLLDDHHPDHAIWISNAHHGVRTTDPFDPKKDELLFRCGVCNLKLSRARESQERNLENTCKSCSGEDDN